jgi:hypothetical protein
MIVGTGFLREGPGTRGFRAGEKKVVELQMVLPILRNKGGDRSMRPSLNRPQDDLSGSSHS